MPTERIAILVDGSNMYHYLRELGLKGLAEFDYRAFAQFLASGRKVVSATYYVGKVRARGDAKSEELRQWQQRLVAHLQNMGWCVEYGHMLENNGVFQEKGVDVHIAVDLLEGAYANAYDTAVLVSSDTDLIPAVHSVRRKRKKVEYIGFAHRPSFGLIKNVDSTTTLRREDLVGFLKGRHDHKKTRRRTRRKDGREGRVGLVKKKYHHPSPKARKKGEK
ncbi:NYN domain-containing protein [Candidatus Peregrinibacteria bacterium]|nr:NYN domain-containing protein [Candidatus Peregrinibacteria bacterium]